MTVLIDMRTAPTAGLSTIPLNASDPAASGIATMSGVLVVAANHTKTPLRLDAAPRWN